MSQGFREKYNVPSVPYGSNVISRHFLKVWTNGGARELELETLNLRWLMLTLSSMSVPNFTTFLQSVLWAAIDLRRKRKNNNNKYSCKQQLRGQALQRQIEDLKMAWRIRPNATMSNYSNFRMIVIEMVEKS